MRVSHAGSRARGKCAALHGSTLLSVSVACAFHRVEPHHQEQERHTVTLLTLGQPSNMLPGQGPGMFQPVGNRCHTGSINRFPAFLHEIFREVISWQRVVIEVMR